MKNLIKIALTCVGGIVAYKVAQFFGSFQSFEELSISADKVNVRTTLSEGVSVMVTPLVKNPTKSTLTLTQPFVKLFSQGVEVATSNLQNKTHTLQPLQQRYLDTVVLTLAWEQVVTIAEKIKISIPKTTAANKILYLIANTKPILNQTQLTIQVITHANGVYYKSEHIKVQL